MQPFHARSLARPPHPALRISKGRYTHVIVTLPFRLTYILPAAHTSLISLTPKQTHTSNPRPSNYPTFPRTNCSPSSLYAASSEGQTPDPWRYATGQSVVNYCYVGDSGACRSVSRGATDKQMPRHDPWVSLLFPLVRVWPYSTSLGVILGLGREG